MADPVVRAPTYRAPAWSVEGTPPVFPILLWDRQGAELRTDAMPGTAFFVATGIFLTAAHVLTMTPEPENLRVLIIDRAAKLHYPLPFQTETHPELDVAVGLIDPPPGIPLLRCRLGAERLAPTHPVVTYGFGEYVPVEHEGTTPGSRGLTLNLWPALRRGEVIEYFPDRAILTKGPAYLHSVYTPGGSSGAPMMDPETSKVYGVVSSGMDPADIADATGVATAVEGFLDWPIAMLGGKSLRDLSYEGRSTLAPDRSPKGPTTNR